MIGIYMITNCVGESYIGQSIDIDFRISSHKKLSCGTLGKLRESIVKYGIDNHTFIVVEQCEEKDLNARERFWQLHFNTIEKGLNSVLTQDSFKKPKRLKYGERTKMVTFRIPDSKVDEIDGLIRQQLKKYLV